MCVIKRWLTFRSAVKWSATHVGQCSNCHLRGSLEKRRLFQWSRSQPTVPIMQTCTERRRFTTSDAPSSLSTNTGRPRAQQHLSQSLASFNITIFSLCFLTDDGASLLCKCQMNHKPIPYAIAICWWDQAVLVDIKSRDYKCLILSEW